MIVSATTFKLSNDVTRYETAMRAIAGIESMKLEEPHELNRALAILEQERENLKFHRSKLFLLGLNDFTFTIAVKEACPHKAAAAALIDEWRADPRAVLKLNGARALSVRLQQSTAADAAALRRVAMRFRAFAGGSGGSASAKLAPVHDPYRSGLDFWGIILVTAAWGIISGLADFASQSGSFFGNASAELVMCQLAAVAKWQHCQRDAQARRIDAKEKDRLCAICTSLMFEQAAQCLEPPLLRRSLPWGVLPTLSADAAG